MSLLIKFPTRSRPRQFFEVLDKYLKNIDHPETSIIISADTDDPTMNWDGVTGKLTSLSLLYDIDIKIFYGDNKSKIEAVNADLKGVDFDYVILASDDMVPLEYGFDHTIIQLFEQNFEDTDGHLWLNDGKTGKKLNTICCVGKMYYDRFGYLYHPTYKSLWCDNEFTDVALKLKKTVYFAPVLIEHQHPDWHKGVRVDNLYLKNNTFWHQDEKNYKRRKALGFPINE